MKKKFIIIVMVLVLAIVLVGCGVIPSNTNPGRPPLGEVDRDLFASREAILEQLTYYKEVAPGRVTVHATWELCEVEFGYDAIAKYSVSLYPHSSNVKSFTQINVQDEVVEEVLLVGDTFYDANGNFEALFFYNDNFLLLSDLAHQQEALFVGILTATFVGLGALIKAAVPVIITCIIMVGAVIVLPPLVQTILDHPLPWHGNPSGTRPDVNVNNPPLETSITYTVTKDRVLELGKTITSDNVDRKFSTGIFPAIAFSAGYLKVLPTNLRTVANGAKVFNLLGVLPVTEIDKSLGILGGGIFTPRSVTAQQVATRAGGGQLARKSEIHSGIGFFPHYHAANRNLFPGHAWYMIHGF